MCCDSRGGHPVLVVSTVLALCCFVNLAASVPLIRQTSDECDWFGSGSDDGHHSVQPVYLRCREGAIEWSFPRGAVRVVLRLGQSGRDFQACLKVSWNSSGASLFLEGPRDLHLLSPYNESKQQCFMSAGGQLALYLEAQGSREAAKNVFKLVYDLQTVRKESFSECRPCTERELVYSFCTSDFVVRGIISSLYENEIMDRSELTVKAKHIIRDSKPGAFRDSHGTNQTAHFGTLYRPLSCGTKVGVGEFLFLGRWRLGDPVLRCAPRWTEWKKVRRKMIFTENVDCILE